MIARYFKFMISRTAGTVVDTAVLWLLAHYIFSGGYLATYILSPIISFEAAVVSNFLLSYYWIWSSRIDSRTHRSFWHHFVAFNISSLAGFGVKMIFLLLFERLFGWNVVLCNLVALCISGMLNFFLSDSLVFRKCTPPPTRQLIDSKELADISPLFRGEFGQVIARGVMRILEVDKLNRLYDHIATLEGPSVAREALNLIGCDYLVGNPERLHQLPEGPFITISNHPYGALDGIILLDLVGHLRPDLKIMANKILGRVEPLKGNFITVTTTESVKQSADATTLRGIRSALAHLKDGHPLGLFPSGAVSDLHPTSWHIADRQWQEGIVKFIGKSGVPVVPIRFEGRNSLLYYLLGLVDWRIRLLRLPHEVLNKGRGTHRLVVGEVIRVEELRCSEAAGNLSEMLRSSVYNLPKAHKYVPVSQLRGELKKG